MKRIVLKAVASILVFFLSLAFGSFFMNKGNVNTTRDMDRASYPVIYMNVAGETVNELYGYTDELELGVLRENITPLDENRGVNVRIVKYGKLIESITAQIRTVDGERLIETIDITDASEDAYGISFYMPLKDLISQYTEYSLQIFLDIGNKHPVMYHTRVLDAPSYCAKEKLAFVMDFHRKSLRAETAAELNEYMESNSLGDNTTLSYVNIHSSMDQLSFAGLQVKEETDPVCEIKELASETAVFKIKYLASTKVDDVVRKYFVEENYRIKYTTENTYLLDYERTMNQLPSEERISPYLDTILLGITDKDIGMVESEDGNIIAFNDQNVLYSYNISENSMARLFSFYDNDNFDERTYHNDHKIKVLSVDEANNVTFVVYGYMNRGTYEGRVGLTLYEYNGVTNVINDLMFIPSDKSPDMVIMELDELSYLNMNGYYFFMMDRAIYSVDIENKKVVVIVSDLEDNMYSISESRSMVVWQDSEDVNASEKLFLMNLNTYQISEITTDEDKFIKPLAFMGEDFIYGLAFRNDVVTDNTGRTTFPMYCLKIQNEFGELLKVYETPGIYVSEVIVRGNLLQMNRVKKSDKEILSYLDVEADYMTNNQISDKLSNKIEKVDYGVFEKVVQIRLAKEASGKTIWKTPKEVIYEGNREITFERAPKTKRYYYVYYKGSLQAISTNESLAVRLSDENYGTVVNDSGFYVWYRANRELRNQIMDLTLDKGVEDESEELSFCLDRILEYEGVIRNSRYLLNRGNTVLSILSDNLEKKDVLNLTGCSLDSILYYVNRDIPVLAMTNTDKTYIIIGFNQLAVVLVDPSKGTYKIGRNEAEELFTNNGNQFITYVPNVSN